MIDPLRSRDWQVRFWARVDKSGECWLWTGPVVAGSHPYGEMMIDRKRQRTHRLSYVLNVGPIPPGMSVLHRCDNPRCVRPDHLFLGTQADNIADMDRKGRGGRARPRLSDEDVATIRLRADEPQRRLAEAFGCSQARISQILAGARS